MLGKERASSPAPGPTYMSSAQMANYLNDLRTNRPARPTGARPPPAKFGTWSSRTSQTPFVETPAVSPFTHPTFKDAGVDVEALQQDDTTKRQSHSHRRTTSNMSIDEVLAGTGGRPLVQQPRGRDMSTSSTSRSRTPSVTYQENGQRKIEREEARALRIAMEELDLKSEEKLYNDARDEAAELVWKHINPNAPENNPDAPYAYPGLTRKGSHNRSRSLGRAEQDLQRTNSKLRKRNSMGGSSAAGSRSSSLQSRRTTSGSSTTANATFGTSKQASPTEGNFEDLTALPKMPSDSVDPQQQRRRSSGTRRKISASLFKNPDDQIYEEPEEETAPPPAVVNPPPPAKMPLQMRRNPFSRVQFARNNSIVRSNTDPTFDVSKRFNRVEIQKNPPSQSRNAGYTLNAPVSKPQEEVKSDAENDEGKTKDGKEIRSDDIRAATSMKLKDRSAKLPTPTAVSDSPGRPIVSFKKDWKVTPEVELVEEKSILPHPTPRSVEQAPSAPRPLSKSATAPVVPTINFPDEPPRPSQSKVEPPLPAPLRIGRAVPPTINVYEDPPAATRPLPEASRSRKVNNLPTVSPPVPTINVSQAPSARSKPASTPSIPTISVQETPTISVSSAPDRSTSVTAPSISITPSIPTIAVDEPQTTRAPPKMNAPSISVTPSVPSINVGGPASSTRPLPTPSARNNTSNASKPLPRSNPRSHWTPTNVRTGALCSTCALPIAGRIVSAAGARFHPECFLCHHCGEHLECVAFYPEPDNKRAERITRIHARLNGEDIEVPHTHQPTMESMAALEAEDGDESLRFYCHLDFHELFSPRCKSCKTPIEGEVVVACGAEWHVGHFFCAQCGDPFDSTTPFVEKDGYAWCVGCHTNRYSAKCRKCRRPVTDMVVKALGAEWHGGCFVCSECCGPFDDGRYFLRGESEDPVCVKCEERRLKA